MSQINVNTINPYVISGSITLNGTPIRNNPNQTIIGIGQNTLANATGSDNTALGRGALQSVTTGDSNVAVGNTALSVCTGNDNIAIGRNAASLSTTGSNNITLGKNASTSTITASNEITLGNSSNTVLRCQVTSITSLSDGRDKKDVVTLSAGLDFIKTLKPVEFIWDERDEKGKHDIKDFGFIAQDLKSAQDDAGLSDTLKLVYEENPDKLEASYGKLVPILVKAIQELSDKVKMLENK
jgi:hypothetical protein